MLGSYKKSECIKLLKLGFSYSQIHQKIGLAKSTINHYFSNELSLKDKNSVIEKRRHNWQISYTRYTTQRKENTLKKESEIQHTNARKINKLSPHQLLLIGSALYWSEGGKNNRWGLQFSNSDPHMVLLMMRFFREVCKVKETKFYIQMMIHDKKNEKKSLSYWHKITGVNKNQFKKAFIINSISSKHIRPSNRLPYGTLQIRIHDKIITHTVYGYIQGLKQQSQI